MYLKGTENREVLFNLLLDKRLDQMLKELRFGENQPDGDNRIWKITFLSVPTRLKYQP